MGQDDTIQSDASGSLNLGVDEGKAILTFSHPKSNCLPGDLLRKLAAEINHLSENEDVRVIQLQSAGERAFCAGASFDEIKAVRTLEQSKYFFSGFAEVIRAMRACRKLIVTRVQGKAAGGAVGLIAASDYALATQQGAVRLSELALGIGPFIIGPAVLRKVGRAAFGELAVSAEWRDANWAKQRGLYAGVFDDTAQLDSQVDALVDRLAKSNPPALENLKRVLWEGTEDWEQLLDRRVEVTSRLALGEFVQQKIASFGNAG
ncbi:MAG: enoyl-CoA hydratase/isomerase family protein [Bdellovibrionales bacterium]|nr:enoyl-CoA hydratase/isomerase family protein [Bdellovibrionales bacterium]